MQHGDLDAPADRHRLQESRQMNAMFSQCGVKVEKEEAISKFGF